MSPTERPLSIAGRAGLGPVLLLGLLALAGLGLVVWLGRGEAVPAGGGASAAAPNEGGHPGVTTPAPEGAVSPAPAPERQAEPAAVSPPSTPDLALGGTRKPPDGFGPGTAEIRGYVETSDTTPFPQRWSLALEPSTTLVGRELVEARVVEFSGGVQEFRVANLPLGGYDLIARAEGMNGRRHAVLLNRAGMSPYVTLQLYPAGYLVGRVVDDEGLATEGLRVTLRGAGLEEPRATETDSLGGYRFDQVLDGEYTLTFGDVRSPLLPPTSLRFTAPTMTVPDRELPPVSRLDLLVLDAEGQPVLGARVEGSGPKGGYVSGETDGQGRLRAAHLPPGRYRLTAEHEVLGRVRRSFEVEPEPTEGVLRFRPRD